MKTDTGETKATNDEVGITEEAEEVSTVNIMDVEDDCTVAVTSGFTTLQEYIDKGYSDWREKYGETSFRILLQPEMCSKVATNLLNSLNLNIEMDRAIYQKNKDKEQLNQMDALGIKPMRTIPVGIVKQVIIDTGEIKLLKVPSASSGWIVMKRFEENDKFSGLWQMVDVRGKFNPLKAAVTNLLGSTKKASDAADVVEMICAELANPLMVSKYVRAIGWPHTIVPCFNGVYNLQDHSFTDYNSPDYEARYGRYTFINKLDTAYNAAASSPPFFDVRAFINSLVPGDDEKSQATRRVLWRLMQFAIRRWSGKEGWLAFLNNVLGRAAGHNGKSTFMELIAFLIEHNSVPQYAQTDHPRFFFSNGNKVVIKSIDLWGSKFALGAVALTMWLLYSDEASGKNYIEQTGQLKKIARRQVIDAEKKYEDPFQVAFPGVAMHAQNEYVMTATKDDATFTHRLDLSFEQDYTNGDPNIKNQYIVSEQVAEYTLKILLDEMDDADDYDPKDLALLAENTEAVKLANIPAWRFFYEVLPQLEDYTPEMPTKILYDMYCAWCAVEGIDVLNLSKFQTDLSAYCKKYGDRFEYRKQPYIPRTDVLDWLSRQTLQPLKRYYKDKQGRRFPYVVTDNLERPIGKINVDWLKVQYQARVMFWKFDAKQFEDLHEAVSDNDAVHQ